MEDCLGVAGSELVRENRFEKVAQNFAYPEYRLALSGSRCKVRWPFRGLVLKVLTQRTCLDFEQKHKVPVIQRKDNSSTRLSVGQRMLHTMEKQQRESGVER
jgi:hypothetical protein